MKLEKQSLTKLRGLAQSLGISNVFQKTHNNLVQEIKLKQGESIPEPKAEIQPPMYDARLMNRPPSKKSEKDDLLQLLEQHIAHGLVIEFPHPEWWTMRFNMKEDSGTMRQPLGNILRCANEIMR